MRPIVRFLLLLALGGAGIGACLAALIPGISTVATAQHFTGDVGSKLKPLSSDTVVYAADGTVLDRLGDQDRTPVKLGDVPKTLIDAVIATEDKTFYQNAGVDISSTLRALATNVGAGGVSQGGSTITQQLVKNRVKAVGTKRDLSRKIKEAILAYRLNDRYSKNYILEQYLNTVYFGELSYGVSSAALRFFGKPLSQLNLADSALLAGVISSPSSYDPFIHPKLAKQRQIVVLKHMQSQHYITKTQLVLAAFTSLPTIKPPAEQLRPNSYYVAALKKAIIGDPKNQFAALGNTAPEREKKLLNGGLKIYTAEDPARQQQAENAFKSAVTGDWGNATGALVAMDPATGHVLAIANKDPFGYGLGENQQDYAVDSHRNEGSTYKAITLATAFSNGYSPNDTVDGTGPCDDVPNIQGTGHNADDGSEGGVHPLSEQTANSVNCAFLRLAASVGNNKIADMAVKLGGCYRPTEGSPCLRPNAIPNLTLGTQESSPLDMATVYNTIADDGVRHDAVLVTKITDADGSVLYQDKGTALRVLDPQVAHEVTALLQGVINNGTGSPNAQLDRPAAGKTGTNDGQKDAWFDGYVPQLTAVVWMGDPRTESPMGTVSGVGQVFGGSLPAKIWHDFMTAALDGVPVKDFQAPDESQYPPSAFIDVFGRHVGGGGSDFGRNGSGNSGGAGPDNAAPTPTTAPPPGPAPTATTGPAVHPTTTTAAKTPPPTGP